MVINFLHLSEEKKNRKKNPRSCESPTEENPFHPVIAVNFHGTMIPSHCNPYYIARWRGNCCHKPATQWKLITFCFHFDLL